MFLNRNSFGNLMCNLNEPDKFKLIQLFVGIEGLGKKRSITNSGVSSKISNLISIQ